MLLCRELKPSGPNYGNPKPVGGLTFARCSSLQLHVYVIPAQYLYGVRKPKNMGNHIPFSFFLLQKDIEAEGNFDGSVFHKYECNTKCAGVLLLIMHKLIGIYESY